MKIAVSSCGIFLDSPVDPRFGRCDYFVIVDTADMSFEVFENQSEGLAQWAGVQAARFVASKGAELVIARHIGPNALTALLEAEIEVVLCQSDSIKEAIQKYRQGLLKSATAASVRNRYGLVGKPARDFINATNTSNPLNAEEKEVVFPNINDRPVG